MKSEKESLSSPNPGSSASPESSPEVPRDNESFRPKDELTSSAFAVPQVRHGNFVSSFSAPDLVGAPAVPTFDSFPEDLSKIPSSSTWQDFRDHSNYGGASYAGSSYASTSHAPSVSGYTESTNAYPTSYPSMGSGSFAQEANKVNNELNALFSTELFDKFFHDYLTESKSATQGSSSQQPFASPTDQYAYPFDVNSQFPFATEPISEPQPFMGSVPPELDEEFLNQLCTPPPDPYASWPTPSMPQLPPQHQPLASSSTAPYPSELQHYSTSIYFMRPFSADP